MPAAAIPASTSTLIPVVTFWNRVPTFRPP
jgi:hypothetical protein